jgi:hypothetical protein
MNAFSGLVAEQPLGHAPPRRAGSIRRTTTMEMTFPQGRPTPLLLRGYGRDIFTANPHIAPRLLIEDRLEVRVGQGRLIEFIATQPPRSKTTALERIHSITGFRGKLYETMGGTAERGRPLYTLLDDIAGCSLIAGWAFTRWGEDPGIERRPQSGKHPMEGSCVGFRPGSSALAPRPRRDSAVAVLPLAHPDDPDGWHELPVTEGVAMRRARRIDLWMEGGSIIVDAMFQDSANNATGGRDAIHEYGLSMVADGASAVLTEIHAHPSILPYPECPAAADNLKQLVGTPLSELRQRVLDRLRLTAGCTHLNDAIRALDGVPQLLARRNDAMIVGS